MTTFGVVLSVLYIDKVFDKSKKPILFSIENNQEASQNDLNSKIQCFQLGQLDRYSYKYLYLILRRSGSSVSQNKDDSEQSETDMRVYFESYQRCNSMSLSCTPMLCSVVRLPVLPLPRDEAHEQAHNCHFNGDCVASFVR